MDTSIKEIIIEAQKKQENYITGMLHAVVLSLGIHKGYRTLSKCMSDDEIKFFAIGILEETGAALKTAYGITAEEAAGFPISNTEALSNPACDISIRKDFNPLYGFKENNLISEAALLCKRSGIMPYWLTKALAYLFLYPENNSEYMQGIQNKVKLHGIKRTVKEYCSWKNEPELLQLVADRYEEALEDPKENIKEDAEKVALYKRGWEAGFYYEKTIKGCAQCTLLAARDSLGIFDEKVFLVASNLAAGMALCGDGSCGGYTGSLMVIGFKAARSLEDLETKDTTGKYKGFEISQRYHDRFKNCYGGVVCKDVHQCIFNRSFLVRDRENDYVAFEAAGAHTEKCTTVIAMSTYMLIRLIKFDK